jgi:hypothetical protein
VSEVEHGLRAKEAHWRELFQDDAIHGVGIGEDPDNPIIQGWPQCSSTWSRGRAHGILPTELDGVKTVVIITDGFRATDGTSLANSAVVGCRETLNFLLFFKAQQLVLTLGFHGARALNSPKCSKYFGRKNAWLCIGLGVEMKNKSKVERLQGKYTLAVKA